MDVMKNHKRPRCLCITLTVIVLTTIIVVALVVGLYYGLKDPDAKSEPQQKHVPLKILSMRSDGLVGETVKATLTYQASPDHALEWRLVLLTGVTVRLPGSRGHVMQDGDEMLQCSEHIPVNIIRYAYIFVRSGIEHIRMGLNITTLKSVWTYDIPELQNSFLDFNSTVMAPETGDMNITVSLKVQKPGKDDHIHPGMAYFTYMNTSADPPSVHEIFIYNIKMAGPDPFSDEFNATKAKMFILLDYEVAQFGGVLSIHLPEYVESKFLRLIYGKSMDILRNGVDGIMPKDVIGFFDIEEKIPFFKYAVTVTCATMGNPAPVVRIFREMYGNLHLVKSDTFVKDQWTHIETITLRDRMTEIGNYTCSATSGSKTITRPVEVLAAEETKFIEDKTGLVEKTADKAVVRCTVTGYPVPMVMFREKCNYGPDMEESHHVEYDRTEADTTVSLTMTLSEPDTDLLQVCCVAGAQTTQGHDSHKVIALAQNGKPATP